MSDAVRVEVTGEGAARIGRITLDAPDRLNAVDAPMLDAITDAVPELVATQGVRLITLTGTGRGFCSGAHLGEAAAGQSLGPDIGTDTLAAAGRAITALVGAGVPTVALVNGVAAGVGCSLALACDYVLATESASFMLAFSGIGLMPDGGATALVAASIGRARAVRMAITAEKVPAPTALDWGLIAECCPDADFATRSAELAAALGSAATQAVTASCRAIGAVTLPDLAGVLAREEDGQLRLLRQEDFREGLTAFRDRRRPRFTGR